MSQHIVDNVNHTQEPRRDFSTEMETIKRKNTSVNARSENHIRNEEFT